MRFIEKVREAEHWFNTRFAWFFTNGMKAVQKAEKENNSPFRA